MIEEDFGLLGQLIAGGAASACTIAVHAMVMTTVIWAAQTAARDLDGRRAFFLPGIMTVTVLSLMTAHTAEVLVWAFVYKLVDLTPDTTSRVYFAFVNYTTLGYGDIIPVRRWQLLGPITAMNGVLLFGWSTAVIFEVLRKAYERTPAQTR